MARIPESAGRHLKIFRYSELTKLVARIAPPRGGRGRRSHSGGHVQGSRIAPGAALRGRRCNYDLYYVHDRKMMLLNQSVHGLIKVQDIVNRLLHESLDGDLVDTSRPDWERTQLTRANVDEGLKAKCARGAISQAEFDAITHALAIPKNTPRADIANSYRNRLMHHIRPSVDYSMFFSALESRAGEEVEDAQGKVIGRRYAVFSRPPVQYRFEDLQAALSEYLDLIVAMLQRLSQIDILRR